MKQSARITIIIITILILAPDLNPMLTWSEIRRAQRLMDAYEHPARLPRRAAPMNNDAQGGSSERGTIRTEYNAATGEIRYHIT